MAGVRERSSKPRGFLRSAQSSPGHPIPQSSIDRTLAAGHSNDLNHTHGGQRSADLVVFYVSAHTNPKRQRVILARGPRWRFLKLRLFAGRVYRPVDFDTFLVGPGDPTYGMHGEFDFAQLQNWRFGLVLNQPPASVLPFIRLTVWDLNGGGGSAKIFQNSVRRSRSQYRMKG